MSGDPNVGMAASGTSTSATASYSAERVIGNGSFGVVFQATVVGTGETVAIKKVLQDRRFKNRELQIMRMVQHPNIVEMKHCFYSTGKTPDEIYLNLVLEYVPDTVYRMSRQYAKLRFPIPILHVKIFIYQLARALALLHHRDICHRDIKPQNLLLDPQTDVLKLCDFGSAKVLVPGEPNVSYICSRYYRAPELIFGATDYTTAIDIWSVGCVLAELIIHQPLFPGETGVDQLVEIIKVLGTPSRDALQAMNKNYVEFSFPEIRPHKWDAILGKGTSSDAIDLISKLLVYTPSKRLSAWEVCAHPFFDDIRLPNQILPNGRKLPHLFNFSAEEIASMPPQMHDKLIPPFVRLILPIRNVGAIQPIPVYAPPQQQQDGQAQGSAASATAEPSSSSAAPAASQEGSSAAKGGPSAATSGAETGTATATTTTAGPSTSTVAAPAQPDKAAAEKNKGKDKDGDAVDSKSAATTGAETSSTTAAKPHQDQMSGVGVGHLDMRGMINEATGRMSHHARLNKSRSR